VRAAVVAAGDGAEALLPSSIPDLQLYGLALKIESTNFEVNTDRRQEALIENVVGETQKQRALTNG